MKFTKEHAIPLMDWYYQNKRSLPWRDTNNAYDVYLSEIMLQQTRVEAVKEKFIAFKQEVPTIKELSEIDDDKLMKLWEGLGYYNRARNLKKCAIELTNNHQATLPNNHKDLLSLPGIGPYTAGAIASIAYNQPIAAVDGNVLRVLARLFAYEHDIKDPYTRTQFEDVLNTFYQQNETFLLKKDTNAYSTLTQSLMELGALICVPNGTPNCQNCPLNKTCKAYQTQTTNRIPYRSPSKRRTIQKRTVLILKQDNNYYIQKRKPTGLLANLYEFYGIDEKQSLKKLKQQLNSLTILSMQKAFTYKHIFSHIEWHMDVYEIEVKDLTPLLQDNSLILSYKDLNTIAIPSAFKPIKDYIFTKKS